MSTFPLGSSVSVWPLIGGDTQKHWVLDQLLVGHRAALSTLPHAVKAA